MILALMIGCVSPTVPQTLESVTDAPLATSRDLTFHAVAHPQYRGRIEYSRSRQGPPLMLTRVVVPLLPSGATLPDAEVPAWVSHDIGRLAATPMEPWLERVRTTFDGRTTKTHRALPKTKQSPWAEAIAEAEKRLGIRSHPDAPVLQLE